MTLHQTRPDPPCRRDRHRGALRFALALMLAALATGCATSRSSMPFDDPVPAAWNSASPAGVETATPQALASWWTRFQDPVLDELVTVALAESPDLATARSRVEQARAQRRIARASLLPALSGSASASRSRSEDLDTDAVLFSEGSGAGLSASWEADLFGANRQQARAAGADLGASEEALRGVRVALAAKVASSWFELRALDERLAATRRSLAMREESLQLERWRVAAGLDDELDLQQALASAEQARAQLPALEQGRRQAASALAVLCGRAPGAFDTLIASAVAAPVVPPDVAPGLPAATLSQRPDLRQAEQQVQAAVARRRAAERSRLPSLTLTGTLRGESPDASELLSPERMLASAAAGLAAPLFQAGALSAKARAQREAEMQAWQAWRATALGALAEVGDAIGAVQNQRLRREALGRAAAAGRQSAELAALRVEAGAADRLTLLDAQRTSLSLDESLADARAAELQAHAALYAALGGGWEAETER